MKFLEQDPIAKLGLSPRAYNALRRGGIHTIGSLLACTNEDLLALPQFGLRTLEEIRYNLAQLSELGEASEKPFVPEVDSFLSLQDPIDKLGFSIRTFNILKRAGIDTIGSLLSYTDEELLSLRYLSEASLEEIQRKITRILPLNDATAQTVKAEDDLFIAADGEVYHDKALNKMLLPPRLWKACQAAGIAHLSQILGVESDALKRLERRKGVVQALQKAAWTVPPRPASTAPHVQVIAQRIRFKASLRETLAAFLDTDVIQLSGAIEGWIDGVVEGKPVPATLDEIEPISKQQLSDIPSIKQALMIKVTNIVASHPYGLDLDSILASLPLLFQDQVLTSNLMSDLLAQEKVSVFSSGRFYVKRMNLTTYIQTVLSEREATILTYRLNGVTLEAIGEELGVSRERVRQICTKILYRAHPLAEDIYANLYQTYLIEHTDFFHMFQEPEITYSYLSLAYEKGSRPLQELPEDKLFPSDFREAAASRLCQIEEEAFKKDYVQIGNAVVRRTPDDLLFYLLRSAGPSGLHFDDLMDQYDLVVQELELSDDPFFKINRETCMNKLTVSNQVLWKFGRRLRYYDINDLDVTELLATLNLDSYVDVEISTRKLMWDQPDLMQDYGINDEYELHNLLKKVCTNDRYPSLAFSRMPYLVFGQADRDKQVMDLLLMLAPITTDAFAIAYEQAYGVLPQTMLANFGAILTPYYHNGIYKIDAPELPPVMQEYLGAELTEDFYTLDATRQLYRDLFPGADENLLNPFSIKRLGFHVFSTYIIRNTYESAADYFRSLMMPSEPTRFSEELKQSQMFWVELSKHRASYDLLECAPGEYISIQALEPYSVTKDLIKNYCRSVYDSSAPEYFTIHSLRRQGFTHPLEELGLDDWFYASLLRMDRTHFSRAWRGNNMVLRRGTIRPAVKDFVAWLVSESGGCNLETLHRQLVTDYNFTIEPALLMQMITTDPQWYDATSNHISIDSQSTAHDSMKTVSLSEDDHSS